MNPDSVNIDPSSTALQYRIEAGGDTWILRREHPEMPMTPDEHYAMCHIRAVMPTTDDDQIVVPEKTRERLDAGVGDVVSVITVASIHALVLAESVTTALQPLVESVNRAVTSVVSELQSAMADAFSTETAPEQDDAPRLPKKIREARARRDAQRESQRNAAGDQYFDLEENNGGV